MSAGPAREADRRRSFTTDCRDCERLAGFLDEVRERYPDYYARPVPSFGEPDAALLIVGLAPGLHGANATGRPFTGDFAGLLLYRTLFDFGFATQPRSRSADDGLALIDCRITNAVRCVPPANKPLTREVDTCNRFLKEELETGPRLVIALGGVAHRAVLRAIGLKLAAHPFAHGALHAIGGGTELLDSYHCSRYNTQTGRLTEAMFRDIFETARTCIDNDDTQKNDKHRKGA